MTREWLFRMLDFSTKCDAANAVFYKAYGYQRNKFPAMTKQDVLDACERDAQRRKDHRLCVLADSERDNYLEAFASGRLEDGTIDRILKTGDIKSHPHHPKTLQN